MKSTQRSLWGEWRLLARAKSIIILQNSSPIWIHLFFALAKPQISSISSTCCHQIRRPSRGFQVLHWGSVQDHRRWWRWVNWSVRKDKNLNLNKSIVIAHKKTSLFGTQFYFYTTVKFFYKTNFGFLLLSRALVHNVICFYWQAWRSSVMTVSAGWHTLQ